MLNNKKHTYKNINFASNNEVEFYKLLELKLIPSPDFVVWEQPEKIEILETGKSKINKTRPAMNYVPDFILGYKNKYFFIIEIKGKNDLVFKFMKGRPPAIQNNEQYYRLKHKIIDYKISQIKNRYFMVVRNSELKTPPFNNFYWENDFQKLKEYKTKKRLDLAEKVPTFIQRLELIIKELENE